MRPGSQIDVSVGSVRGIPAIDEEVNEMSEWVWVLIAVLVVVAVIVVGWSLSRRKTVYASEGAFRPGV